MLLEVEGKLFLSETLTVSVKDVIQITSISVHPIEYKQNQ